MPQPNDLSRSLVALDHNPEMKGMAILEYYRLRAQEFAEQRKPQPAPPTNPAPGSLEWQAEQNKSS
jgi:hypothetical protein